MTSSCYKNIDTSNEKQDARMRNSKDGSEKKGKICKYAEVVIEANSNMTDALYTYAITADQQVEIGSKIQVPFGRSKKLKDAYVMGFTDQLPDGISEDMIKSVQAIDQDISLNCEITQTAHWMRNYYMCRYMECLKLFLPMGTKAKRRVSREIVDDYEGEEQNIEKLTDEQQMACAVIKENLEQEKSQVFLLEGVTGSGKTEVYMQAMAETLALGKNGIMIVPEVALTKQIIDRFIVRFGRENVAVMHSKMTAGERYDQWQKIRQGKVSIVIGARSAVFAPLENIGLIVIDEEHESSYKSDMSPKYETWRVAKKRCKYYGGSVILGSGTPSIDSLYRASCGEMKKIMLTKRYNGVELPKAQVVDMREEIRAGNKTVFSRRLFDQVKKALDEQGQVILFINRRGYSPYVFCRECGYKVECCGQPMNYHKQSGKMICHYCGRRQTPPDVCPECGSRYIRYFGAGTEQIEEAAKRLFPNVTVERLDTDTGKTVKDINRILNNFNKGKTKILVGTQLVGKGMDNPNVKVVGIMAIDSVINYPDYRSAERAFQLIAQAGGRAGRGEEVGNVIIQTYEPESYPIVYGGAHNVEGFYSHEIKRRMLLGNPPFSQLVQVVITDKDMSGRCARALGDRWRIAAEKVIGKEKVLSIKNRKREKDYQICILFKFENEKREEFRNLILNFKEKLKEERNNSSFIVEFEPNNLWR